jgi:hypothetical protein
MGLRRISAAFVFPSPVYLPTGAQPSLPSSLIKTEDLAAVSGAFLLGLHLRVGRAVYDDKGRLELSFAGSSIWRADRGFAAHHARELLRNTRRLGSRKVDICRVLKGLDTDVVPARRRWLMMSARQKASSKSLESLPLCEISQAPKS